MTEQVKYLYYIMDHCAMSDPELGIKETGVCIFRYPLTINEFHFKEAEGPYYSIRNLKKISTIFRQLLHKNAKKANQIIQEKNIRSIINHILVEDKNYSKEYIKLFSHTIKGKIKNKQVFGIHFFDPLSMRIKEMINNDNKNGVWEAIIEVYDKEREQWYSKKTTSTFFPRDWPLDRLFQECDFAFENKTKDINSNSRFISKTLSGIDVVIIIENDIVKSIYPVNNDREDCLGHI